MSGLRRAGGWPVAMGLAGLLGCDPPPRDHAVARAHPDLRALTEDSATRATGKPTSAEPAAPATDVAPKHEAPVLAAARPTLPPPPPRADTLELTFVGDVILGRYRETGYDPIPKDGHPLFDEIGPLMGSDLLVGNLETPLIESLPDASPVVTRYSFGADATLARHLALGGFDAMSLANNHAFDLRADGVEQTPAILQRMGITPVGAARHDAPPFRVETVEREGWRVGLIAATTHANIPSLAGLPEQPLLDVTEIEATLTPLVEDARVAHDLVVVLMHWGDEYADQPAWEQRQAAYALVEAGADLVVGSHPHVLQGIETHGHGVIAYSLGNFVFENVKDVPRLSGVLRVRADARGCLDEVRLHPAFIKSIPIKYPAPATGYMGSQVKERVQTLSRPLGARFADDGDDLVLRGVGCPRSASPAPPAARAGL